MRDLLLDAVDQLIHEHKTSIHTDDGLQFHDQPALLEQLHGAIFMGSEQIGGGAFGAKLPLNPAAVDLAQLIDQQAAEAWTAVTGRVPGMQKVERLIAEWAAGVADDAVVTVTHPEQVQKWDEGKGREVRYVVRLRAEYTPLDLARHWIHLIEDFFQPEHLTGIAAPCIQCGERKVIRRRDGEDVAIDALQFHRDRETGDTIDIRCLACGTKWGKAQFEYVARSLSLSLTPVGGSEKRVQRVEWSGSRACADDEHPSCSSLKCRCECHMERTIG